MCQEVKSNVLDAKSNETWYREPVWQDHISAFQTSDMDIKEYCKANDLKVFQFIYWQRKLSEQLTAV